MCLRPVTVKNPNFFPFKGTTGGIALQSLYRNTVSTHIQVPCGVCEECLSLRQHYWLQRCEMMSLTHHIYFCTLTYCNDALPFLLMTGKDGVIRRYNYASYADFKYFIKRLRARHIIPPGTKYVACTEYGHDKHRPHFHILFFIPKTNFNYADCVDKDWLSHSFHFDNSNPYAALSYEDFLYKAVLSQWKRKISKSRKHPQYINLCNYRRSSDGRSNYDLHYVVPFRKGSRGKDQTTVDVCAYVTKYILKYDPWVNSVKHAIYNNHDDQDYHFLWSFLRPRCFFSKNFGFPADDESPIYLHIQKCIDFSKASAGKYDWQFIDYFSGKLSPLSPYYRDRFVTADDYLRLVGMRKVLAGFNEFDDYYDYQVSRIEYDPYWSEPRFDDKVSKHRAIHDALNRRSDIFDIFDYGKD